MRRLLLLLVVTCSALACSAGVAGARTPLQVFQSKYANGLQLATAYSNQLVQKDRQGLSATISPAFQIQRADGSHADREAYLAKLPGLRAFSFADASTTKGGGVLTFRAEATSTLFVNGAMYSPKPAPLMVVFQWTGARWVLVGQGNFNLPKAG